MTTYLKKIFLSLSILINFTHEQEGKRSSNYNEKSNEEFLLMKDIQIKSPLTNNKRFLGWYVDGKWEVLEQELTFINYTEKAFLLTNNLMFRSNKLIFDLELTIQQDFEKSKKDKNLVKTTEVLFFNFAPEIYPIRKFNAYSTETFLKGITIFMFRKNGSNIIYLKDFFESLNYDLQLLFSEYYKQDGRLYCEMDYLNKKNKFKFIMDFLNKQFFVFVNDIQCIKYSIPDVKYEAKKSTLTFSGYSTSLAPLNVIMHECSIYKFTNLNSKEEFHSNIITFQNTLTKFNPLHTKNASLSNIFLIQKKTKNEIQDTANILELMAKRTNDIEISIKDQVRQIKNNTNIFYDSDEYVDKLRNQVKNFHFYLNSNKKMEESFEVLRKGFENVNELYNLMKNLDDVNDSLAELDSLIQVDQYKLYLNELQEMEKFMKENEISIVSDIKGNVYEKLSNGFKIWGKLKIFAILLMFGILLMIVKIVRMINDKMKEDLF